MLTNCFKVKINNEEFKNEVNSIITELKDKKVLVFGDKDKFFELNKKFELLENLDIVALTNFKIKKQKTVKGLNFIPTSEILNQDYDVILSVEEDSIPAIDFIEDVLKITNKDIKKVFTETFSDEILNINYIENLHFSKSLKNLKRKLKNKTVVIYGTGVYFQTIQKYYDLSGINIIGVSDKRFECHEKGEQWQGYNVYAPSELKDLNPDYVIVATKMFLNIIYELYYEKLKDTKIKIKPLVKKNFWILLKEIWF